MAGAPLLRLGELAFGLGGVPSSSVQSLSVSVALGLGEIFGAFKTSLSLTLPKTLLLTTLFLFLLIAKSAFNFPLYSLLNSCVFFFN
jgi:small basic protein